MIAPVATAVQRVCGAFRPRRDGRAMDAGHLFEAISVSTKAFLAILVLLHLLR